MLSCTTLNVYCNRFNVLCFPSGQPAEIVCKVTTDFSNRQIFLTFFSVSLLACRMLALPGITPAAAVACFPKASAKLYLFPVPTKFFRYFLCFITYFFLTSFLSVDLKKLTSRQFHSLKNLVKSLFILFFLDDGNNSHDFHCRRYDIFS